MFDDSLATERLSEGSNLEVILLSLLLRLLLLLLPGLVELQLLRLDLGLDRLLDVGGVYVGGGGLDVARLDGSRGRWIGRGVRFGLLLESWHRFLEGRGGRVREDHRG